MNIAGIELRYLASSLDRKTKGYYVSNIYGVSRQSLLLKLHHPESPDIMLMFSTMGLWESAVRIGQIEPNRLLARLRRDLARLRVEAVEQPGTERMAYLRLGGFGRERVLVGEFFGDGNIVLCDGGMKILALLHSLEVRHRRLAVGLEYAPPPPNSADVLAITGGQLGEALRNSGAGAGGGRTPQADRWLGRTLGLPARYVGRMLDAAGIDAAAPCSDLSGAGLDGIAASVRRIAGDVASGRHEPALVLPDSEEGGDAEVHPVTLSGETKGGAFRRTPLATFEEGLDKLFTEQILEAGRAGQSRGSDSRIGELRAQIDDQTAAAAAVRERAAGISALAGALQAAAASARSLSDPAAAGVLAAHGAERLSDRGAPVVAVAGLRIAVDPSASLHSTASRLYDEAKRQSAAAPRIEALRRKAEKKLAGLQGRSEAERRSVTFAEVRKKAWYERYRWFFTTGGLLAVGGRDSSSNSSIIRRHLEPGDAVFHAEVGGSPFFVLKGALAQQQRGRRHQHQHQLPRDAAAAAAAAAAAVQPSIEETAHATVCFSRAWREAMYGLSAYWVEPEQVKKSAPSGQFLPKGSFTIGGRRNFVRVPALRLAVGIAPPGGGRGGPALACGPPQAVREFCTVYAAVEPGQMGASDAAKRLRGELARLDEEAAAALPLDEYVRVLPAGRTRVAGAERGRADSAAADSAAEPHIDPAAGIAATAPS